MSPGGTAQGRVAAARRVGVVVQARLGSTRLARKALLPLGGATLLDMVLARLALVEADLRVLATEPTSAGELAPIARRHGFELLVGPEEDVLGRYCMVIREFGLDRVIRATGDNPLVCHEAANLLIASREGSEADYASHVGLPLGMGVESVNAAALLLAERDARDAYEREHVCPHLYNNPGRFSIDRPDAPADYRFPEGRVTVDTQRDYEFVRGLYGAYYDGSPIPSARILGAIRERSTAGGPEAA
ncbi:MAG TPA: NTP transferase domain-containing protein [Rectinemataceae bacterium]|nr:NTP transferase domain-containing protein [Rectinemataceae bacterium]